MLAFEMAAIQPQHFDGHYPNGHVLHVPQHPAGLTVDCFDAVAGASDVCLATRPFSVEQQTSKQWVAFRMTCQLWKMWTFLLECMRQGRATIHWLNPQLNRLQSPAEAE